METRMRPLLCVLLLLSLASVVDAALKDCGDYTFPALQNVPLLVPPWTIASGPNSLVSTVTLDPNLVRFDDNALVLSCILDPEQNGSAVIDTAAYRSGAVTSKSFAYGFIDLRLLTPSNFWETVVQAYQRYDDDTFDYVVIGIAPTYVYISSGVGMRGPAPRAVDKSASLTNLFGPGFDSSAEFHNYSVLRTTASCAVYIDGTYIGGFERTDLGGEWPFTENGKVPIYVMQSNLNARAGENASSVITTLNYTSLDCYSIPAGSVNDLDVSFPSGTADLLLATSDEETDTVLVFLFSSITNLNSTSAAPSPSTSTTLRVPVNPRLWNQSTNARSYKFQVPIGNTTLTATYTFYRLSETIVLGAQQIKVRPGDFRLDLVVDPVLPFPYIRLEGRLASEANITVGNTSSSSSNNLLNMQAGTIAMNISFWEFSAQLNRSAPARSSFTVTNNGSGTVLADWHSSQQLVAFFRIANKRPRGWFRWWWGVVIAAGAVLLLVAVALAIFCLWPSIRKLMRRRRRRAIELSAAKVVTA